MLKKTYCLDTLDPYMVPEKGTIRNNLDIFRVLTQVHKCNKKIFIIPTHRSAWRNLMTCASCYNAHFITYMLVWGKIMVLKCSPGTTFTHHYARLISYIQT